MLRVHIDTGLVSMFNKLQRFFGLVFFFLHTELSIFPSVKHADSTTDNIRTTWTGTSSHMMETTS